jgi:hypothetical protein
VNHFLMSQQNKSNNDLTPMQEFILHLQTNFGYKSIDDNIWLDKEYNALRKAYDEGIEDGGFFGNGKDYVDRTFIK